MSVRGWVLGCAVERRGTELVADAALGATVLYVEDITQFDDVGGVVDVNGQRVSYGDGAIDEDALTITLDGGLVAAATVGDRVLAVSGGQVMDDKVLSVSCGDGDAVEVVVPFDQRDLWPEGDYEDPVQVTLTNDLEKIDTVPGRTPIRILEDATAGDRVPAAPATLTLTTSAYLDGGSRLRAQVVVDWSDVVENVDGSMLENLDHYEVQIHAGLPTDAGTWTQVTRTDAAVSVATLTGYTPGQVKSFRVRAVNTVGGKGAWSTETSVTMAVDNTPPAQPSVPTLSAKLGTIIGRWDGKNSSGAAMDADLAYVEVHRSTTNGFTASVGNTATLIGRIGPGADFFIYSIADGASYNTTYYFKLIAVDTSNNASTPSGQASAAMAPLVDTDLIGQVISGAHIVDGTIAAYDKIIGNTITGALIQALAINAGHINSNAITADKIDAGAVTAVKIAALAIDATKIAAGAITASKLSADAIDGKTITGVTITGGVFQTSGYANTGLKINSDGISVWNSSNAQVLFIGAGDGSITGGAGVPVRIGGTGLNVLAELTVGGNATCSGDATGSRLFATGPDTAGSGDSDVKMGPSGQIKKVVSAEKYKKYIRPAEIDVAAVYALEPVSYEIRAEYRSDEEPAGIREYGVIADQAAELGLDPWVGRNADGEVETFVYSSFTVALLAAARDLNARVSALEGAA